LRKSVITAVVATGVAAIGVGPVIAQSDNPSQTVLSGSAVVSPSKAGTKSKPKGVKLTVKVHWETPEAFDKPITQTSDVLFPKGSKYNGAKYPKCSEQTMSRGGIKACPPHSIMGSGSGVAYADTVTTVPKITVVNGGGSKVYLFTVLKNPARVAAPVPGTITKTPNDPKWAYKLHLVVPTSLQIVAGVPIALRDIKITSGGKSYAKDWLATTGCPASKKWPYQITTSFDNGGSATFANSTTCK
jgi:hypothetical protein